MLTAFYVFLDLVWGAFKQVDRRTDHLLLFTLIIGVITGAALGPQAIFTTMLMGSFMGWNFNNFRDLGAILMGFLLFSGLLGVGLALFPIPIVATLVVFGICITYSKKTLRGDYGAPCDEVMDVYD